MTEPETLPITVETNMTEPKALPIMVEDEHTLLEIQFSWSNDHAVGYAGWVLNKSGPVEKVELSVDGQAVPITSWHPRPDVAQRYPQYKGETRGFHVSLPRRAEHRLKASVTSDGVAVVKDLVFTAGQLPPPADIGDKRQLYDEFRQAVNENRGHVLEIGSRIVSPGSASKRSLFPGAASYTGFDYHPDDNTNLLGDAHRLSEYFPPEQRFDAVFSLAVFEHLAMPWLVVREISKILKVGGLVFTNTVSSWPLHDRPWDFWRFSDDALKLLFSPSLGFEVVGAELFQPLRMHPDQLLPGQEAFPFHACFAGANILAKKVAEVDYENFRWDMTVQQALGHDSHYPFKRANDDTDKPSTRIVANRESRPNPANSSLGKTRDEINMSLCIEDKGLRIDLGCGAKKMAETIGLDTVPAPGVDHVLDLTTARLPFKDRSVSYVFSSHFLEHITNSTHLSREISRICEEGAKLEFWTPYGWSNSAFLLGHVYYYNEDHYLHWCVTFSDHWTRILGARWVLREFQYVIIPSTLCELQKNGISVDYAVRHLHNIVFEIGVHVTISHDLAAPILPVRRTFSLNRWSERYVLSDAAPPAFRPEEFAKALQPFPKAEPNYP